MNLDDILWKNMQRAAANKAMRLETRKRVEAKYKRGFTRATYSSRIEADAAKQLLPADTRSLTARVLGDPLPGRSALDRDGAQR